MRVLRYWRLGPATLVALAAVGVGAALAQPAVPTFPECTKKATPQDNEAAKNAHRVATQFYDRGEYEKAIQYWTDAFKFDCSVNDLLINIANSYEKMGDKAATVVTLEEYLKRTGPNPTIQQKIANLKKSMTPPTPSVTASASAVPTITATPTATATVTTAPTVPSVPEGPRPYGRKPWALVGAGGGLALIGVILLPLGYGNISSADSLCPTRTHCSNDVVSQGNAGRNEVFAGWPLFSTGVGLVVGGLIWQFALNSPRPVPPPPGEAKTGRVWVMPSTTGRGQSGVVLGGSF
jgi:hypothetical protein